ncbi:ATP-binding cassette domain-containing protein [Pseudanabaena sp. FACHB-1998]|uniref:ABC transporter ATP-binding protein n=1 Tax=Pseudanabaena sp. FACHB-1998 TaxID=2692858 RepID=UPI001680626F|nr:ATP-binding cassette domain-containing protein [Pseudanabaena sp. FACHB-1998]MBD2175641.1 ATP-binding cassette domain-containing protein [Pseudanabaena sp. FACHB-1998]
MKVELCHISKSFGNVRANHDISMTVEAGSVYGILGENGAGKSTLSKILSGFITKDSGRILLNGTEVEIKTPADAICAGIGMLHQDPLDFPSLSVLDNFMAGRSILAKQQAKQERRNPVKKANQINRQQLTRELQQLAAAFGFDLHPSDRLENLTVGERQQLEILRLLSLGVQTLILDEPTTGISASQKTALFKAVKQLASEGKSIIFVSHKLEDVEELCDRLMVMRQGEVVGESEIKGRDSAELAASLVDMMFGREMALPAKHEGKLEESEIALSIHDLLIEGDRLSLQLDKLTVKSGEIIGLAGLEGNGQQLLLLACAGLLKPKTGTIRIGDLDMTHRPYRQFLKAGIAYLPADRLQDGLIRGLSIQEHFMLRQASSISQSGIFINWSETRQVTHQAIEKFNIRGKPASKVERLSGGNQQRTQISLLPDYLNLLLMEQPTRGLDIESSLWIWKQMMERCEKGMMIFFISSDLDEILQYSDRILVFSGGKVSQPMDAKNLSVDRLGQAIGGKFE